MRTTPALVVMVLLVSTCVASVEGGPSQPSVSVVTTTVTTTTVAVVTTEAGEECSPHPDGYKVTSRGFVCPPDLPLTTGEFVEAIVLSGGVFTLLEGTYATRLFMVPLEFDLPSRGLSFGEDESGLFVYPSVELQSPNQFLIDVAGIQIFASQSGPVLDLAALASHGSVEVASLEEAARTIGGVPADVLTLRLTDSVLAGQVGVYPIEIRPDGDHRFYSLSVGGTEVLIWVSGQDGTIDTYFTEVAQPILDSIRFLDE